MQGHIEKNSGPVSDMFAHIAGVYDFLNHFLSLGIDRIWRRELTALVYTGKTNIVADLAAGTLDVSLALLKTHPQIIVPAVDFCQPMLLKGQKKLVSQTMRQRILPCAGNALRLPLKDSSVDSVTMAFGIRNISERVAAFREMLRVLVPGGRACILEFGSGQDRIWGGLYNLYLEKILPRLGSLATTDKNAYKYLSATICAFPSAEKLAREMEEAGFGNVGHKKLTSGIVNIHWGEKMALS